MYVHNLNPTLISLGSLEIRWYGLVYVLGFFLAAGWLNYLRKQDQLKLAKEEIWDFLFYVMLGVLIGSRLFMIFWQPADFFFKPWNLIKIWEGGMSFHGGLVGSIITAYWYCLKKKIDFWKLADFVSVPAIFALALGRLANFINGELVGRIWNGNWCVIFPGYEECRHPYTLYAAGNRFLLFGWLIWLGQKFKPGFIFWNLVFWEGMGRIIVDFYREDVLYSGFSLGQWFSLVMVVTALFVFIKQYPDDWKYFIKN